MRKVMLILFMLSIPIVGLVSCSKDKTQVAVATVEDRMISLSYFEKQWVAVDEKFLPESREMDGLVEFLNTLIDKEVMSLKADELGYDKDEYVVQGMEAFKAVGLQAGYIKLKVADKINVTEKHLREAYPNFGLNRRVKQILVDIEEEANEVYEILQTNEDFESVCKEYSKGPDAEKGGEVVNALWGTFPPEFQDELFRTKVGEVTRPILSQYGWFVIKVVSENKPNPKPFDDVRGDLEQILRTHQQIKLSMEMSNAVRDKHGFEFFEDNIKIAFEALPPDRPVTNPPDRSLEVYPLLRFSPTDLDKPLVTYDDKYITIKDFSDLYDRASFFQRPRRQYRLGDIKKFLVDLVMNELIELELAESGIENEPEVRRMLNNKREQLMIDKLYQDLVANQTQVPYNEIQGYYTDNVEQFRRPEERRFGVILTGDKSSAQKAYDTLREGQSFETVREAFHIDEPDTDGGPEGRFFRKGEVEEIDEHGFALKVGGIAPPFETGRGWMVVKCFERTPERIIDVSEAQPEINRYLKTIKNEERLNELLTKWREDYKIEIFEKNLKKANLDRSQKKQGVKFS